MFACNVWHANENDDWRRSADVSVFYCCVLPAGPPTNVGIDFFVQSFGPLDEVRMVSKLAIPSMADVQQSLIVCVVVNLFDRLLDRQYRAIQPIELNTVVVVAF